MKTRNIRTHTPLLSLFSGLCLFFLFACTAQAQSDDLVFVEEQPKPAGGLDAFYKYVSSALQYPEEAQRMGIKGRVYVQFVVDKSGSVSEIQVLQGIGGGCDEEAVRLIKTYAPGWVPAKAGGKPINVEMSLPIRFAPEIAQASGKK